jgi:opacity protein-like surface antigen
LSKHASLPAHAALFCLLTLLALAAGGASALAQAVAPNPSYSRVNTWSIFGAYSGDSSHYLMGEARNRKLLEFGVGYSRRLFHDRFVNWQYNGELVPVALESDPVYHVVYNETSPVALSSFASQSGTEVGICAPQTGEWAIEYPTGTVSGTYVLTCGRQWTVGEAISPAGFQWNFLPRRKLQPFFVGHGGYMYTSQPIPVNGAGTFNFTFDLGTGLELFRTPTRSIRAEFRYHHISNHNTANLNPGIDNGLFQVTYSFGR